MSYKIIFLLIILFAASCAPLKPLEYRSLENFSVSKISATPELTFDLRLYNPNKVGAKLKNFNIDFMLSDMKLTTIHINDAARALPRSDFVIPIHITASVTQLAQFLPFGINSYNSGSTIPVKLDGTVTLKKFLFHKTFPFHFEESLDTKKFK